MYSDRTELPVAYGIADDRETLQLPGSGLQDAFDMFDEQTALRGQGYAHLWEAYDENGPLTAQQRLGEFAKDSLRFAGAYSYYGSMIAPIGRAAAVGIKGLRCATQGMRLVTRGASQRGIVYFGSISRFTSTSENAGFLAKNLAREGREPAMGEAAAHIVASTGSKRQWLSATRSRNLLERYGIDINDAANGIPIAHPRPHNLMHTRTFNDSVEARLSAVVARMQVNYGNKAIRAALRRELRAIGQEVLDGSF